MNFAQMLSATVTPLALVRPRKDKPKKKTHVRNTVNANEVKKQQAIARFRAAWRDGEVWLGTSAIEKRLGKSRSCAGSTLRKWEQKGLMESRQVSEFDRRQGVEWRWL